MAKSTGNSKIWDNTDSLREVEDLVRIGFLTTEEARDFLLGRETAGSILRKEVQEEEKKREKTYDLYVNGVCRQVMSFPLEQEENGWVPVEIICEEDKNSLYSFKAYFKKYDAEIIVTNKVYLSLDSEYVFLNNELRLRCHRPKSFWDLLEI
jgi:hypothetical protein